MFYSMQECSGLTLDVWFQLGEFRLFSEGEISDKGRGMELAILFGDPDGVAFDNRRGCTCGYSAPMPRVMVLRSMIVLSPLSQLKHWCTYWFRGHCSLLTRPRYQMNLRCYSKSMTCSGGWRCDAMKRSQSSCDRRKVGTTTWQ